MRARVLISILVLLALMLLALVFYGHRFVEDSIFEQYLALQESTSSMSALVFSKFIESTMNELQALAKDPNIQAMDEQGRSQLEGLPSAAGGLIGNVTRVDARMRIIYTYPPSPTSIGKYVGDQPHNQEILRTKKPVVGVPFLAVQGYQALPLVQPVFKDGQFDGTIAILLRVEWLDQVFWRPLQRIGEDGIAALVDSKGRVFWSQGNLAVGTSFAPMSSDANSSPDLAQALSLPTNELPASFRTKLPGKQGRWVVAVVNVPVPNANWHLISGIRDESLTASITTYRSIILASSAIVVLLGILFGLYIVEARKHFLAAQERAVLADQFESELHRRTEELGRAKTEIEKHARNLEQLVKQHTTKLQESEELYRQLVDNVTTILFLLDKGKLTYVNPAFLRTLKIPLTGEKQYLGKELVSLIKPESRPALVSAYSALAKGEVAVEISDLEFIASDKEVRVWDGSMKRLETWKRETYLCFFRDVTEQKHIEHQVIQSQKLESVGRLAGGIAHDFNNILAGIFGNLALLREQVGANNTDEDTRRLFETIETAARRAADLTRKLLVFSRKEGEDLKIVDLKQSIEEVNSLLKTTMPRKIAYTQNVCAEALRILGNATEIQQVLLNLCTNAIDSMQDGGKLQVIAARVLAKDDPGASLNAAPEAVFARIRVVDTGSGIDPKIMDKIFEPFFTTKETGKGTGLGLNIVYHIVNKHGGAIDVNSDWGRGSVFSLYFPVAGDDAEMPESIKEYVYPDFAKAKPILVVDDEDMITKPVQRFFEKRGMKVLTANDGVEALDVFKQQQHTIGLVLIDLRMPRLTGSEAFSVIHKLNPKTIGILMTGFGEELSNMDYIRMGFSEVLQKPFSFEELSLVFERYLLKG
jgi:two-component system cell cycle sensor histidine kinase/response regulator CckA